MVDFDSMLKDMGIEVRRITLTNIWHIAEWCGGDVKLKQGESLSDWYIKLNDEDLAFPGDWMARVNGEFQVLNNAEYEELCRIGGRRLENFQKIYELMLTAMMKECERVDSARLSRMREIAEETTRKIIAIMLEEEDETIGLLTNE